MPKNKKSKKETRIRMFYYFVQGVFQASKVPNWVIVETIKEKMDAIEKMEE